MGEKSEEAEVKKEEEAAVATSEIPEVSHFLGKKTNVVVYYGRPEGRARGGSCHPAPPPARISMCWDIF